MSDAITVEELREILDYDAETGIFRWQKAINRRTVPGKVAGTLGNWGYIRIAIRGRRYLAHRLAWLYVHGEWPTEELDHCNRQRSDNRIGNLRPAARHQNGSNLSMRSDNTSGVTGVVWHADRRLWGAQIHVRGRQIHLGRFADFDRAAAARKQAEARYFGEFTPASRVA